MRTMRSRLAPSDFSRNDTRLFWQVLTNHFALYPHVPVTWQSATCLVSEALFPADGRPPVSYPPEQLDALADTLKRMERPLLDRAFVDARWVAHFQQTRTTTALAAANRQISEGDLGGIVTSIKDAVYGLQGTLAPTFSTIRRNTGLARDAAGAVQVSTCLRALDRVLDGGLRMGDLGMVTMATGVGKTNALVHFGAAGAMQPDCRTLGMSLELRDSILRQRYIAMSAVVPATMVRRPLPVWDDAQRLRLAYVMNDSAGVSDNTYFIDLSDNKVTLTEIENHIIMWQEHLMMTEGKLPPKMLILVDWVDLIRPENIRKNEPEHMIVPKILEGLKFIAKRTKCAIWTATQGTAEAITSTVVGAKMNSGGHHKADYLDIGIGGNLAADDQLNEKNVREGANFERTDKGMVWTIYKNRHGQSAVLNLYRAETLRMYDSEADYVAHRTRLEQITPDVMENCLRQAIAMHGYNAMSWASKVLEGTDAARNVGIIDTCFEEEDEQGERL